MEEIKKLEHLMAEWLKESSRDYDKGFAIYQKWLQIRRSSKGKGLVYDMMTFHRFKRKLAILGRDRIIDWFNGNQDFNEGFSILSTTIEVRTLMPKSWYKHRAAMSSDIRLVRCLSAEMSHLKKSIFTLKQFTNT